MYNTWTEKFLKIWPLVNDDRNVPSRVLGESACCNWLAIEHATRLEDDRREALPVLYQAALEYKIEQQRIITSNLGYHRGLGARQITLFHEQPYGEEWYDSWKRIV